MVRGCRTPESAAAGQDEKTSHFVHFLPDEMCLPRVSGILFLAGWPDILVCQDNQSR